MTIDPYQLCPCGSNKKVKFCCAKDISGELDKILNAIEADQRVSALDQIRRLIASKGERDCLLVLQVHVLMYMDQLEEAREIVDRLLDRNPENASVLALAAMVTLAVEGDVDEAVVLLQNAFDVMADDVPEVMLNVIRYVAFALLYEGRLIAGRMHLFVYLSLQQGEDPEAIRAFFRAKGAVGLPALFKSDFELRDPPADAECAQEMAPIGTLVSRARYRSAIERLRELEAKHPLDPVIRYNIAVLESFLGDVPAMVDAWRTVAQNEAMELEDAVEAEALAQLLDGELERTLCEQVVVTFPIEDSSRALEKLQSDPCSIEGAVPSPDFGDEAEQQIPPKATFLLADRPRLEKEGGYTLDDLPTAKAELLLYGKQTDRDARLCVVLWKNDDYDETLQRIQQILGDLIGAETDSEVLNTEPQDESIFRSNILPTPNLPGSEFVKLNAQLQQRVLLEVWPDTPLDVLEGKTAREAAKDPNNEIPLLAAILLLEETLEPRLFDWFDMNDLRSQLGLPTLGPIDPEGIELASLPKARWHRVELSKLPDDQLVKLIREVEMCRMLRVLKPALRELLQRETITDELYERFHAWATLAAITEEDADALECIHRAQELAAAKGTDPALMLIREVDLRLARRLDEGLEPLLARIQRDYRDRPEILQEMLRVFSRHGLIGEGDLPPAAPGGAAGMPAAPPAADAAAGGLWTPGSGSAASSPPPAPAAPPSEKPSKLWLPGMD